MMDDNEKLFRMAGLVSISGMAFAFSDLIAMGRKTINVTSDTLTNGDGSPAIRRVEQVVVCMTGGSQIHVTPTGESVDEVIARWTAYRTIALGHVDAAMQRAAEAEAAATQADEPAAEAPLAVVPALD